MEWKVRHAGRGTDVANAEAQRRRDAKRESSSEWKETEIGLVPVDWKVRSLDELCQRERGGVDPAEIPETPYVSLGHIDSGDPQLHQWGNSTEVKSRKKKFTTGNVLYGRLRPYL